MRKRLSILIALGAAAMIAVATVVPAFANDYFDEAPATVCSAPADHITIELGLDVTGASVYTYNMNADCYWLEATGYVYFANGGGDEMSNSGWAKGYPNVKSPNRYLSDVIVLVDNEYNFCNFGSTQCYGFHDFEKP